MTIIQKHNITGAVSSNGFTGLYILINDASAGWLTYFILLIIFITSSFFVLKKTNDQAKSFLTGGYITVSSALILYYMGKTNNAVIVPEILMLGMTILLVSGIFLVKFLRHNKNE